MSGCSGSRKTKISASTFCSSRTSMQRLLLDTQDEADTARLGRALARSLPETATIALIGTLGAGKTRFVQAVAEGCGIDPASVTSPTFVLCQPYHGTRTLYHLDAYRIRDLDEFLELGVERVLRGSRYHAHRMGGTRRRVPAGRSPGDSDRDHRAAHAHLRTPGPWPAVRCHARRAWLRRCNAGLSDLVVTRNSSVKSRPAAPTA